MDKRLKKQINGESNTLSELVQLAKESVSQEVEPFKTEAFKIILGKLLEKHLHPQPNSGTNQTPKNNDGQRMGGKVEFAKLCNITVNELDDVFSIHDNSINIIAPITGSESFKRLIVAQCYLAAAEQILNKDWIESNELTEVMRDVGVKDLGNMAPQLKKKQDIFRISGKRGNNSYKLTSGIGRKSALSIIHKLAKGEELHEN